MNGLIVLTLSPLQCDNICKDCDLSPPVSSEDGFPGLVDIAETDHV